MSFSPLGFLSAESTFEAALTVLVCAVTDLAFAKKGAEIDAKVAQRIRQASPSSRMAGSDMLERIEESRMGKLRREIEGSFVAKVFGI